MRDAHSTSTETYHIKIKQSYGSYMHMLAMLAGRVLVNMFALFFIFIWLYQVCSETHCGAAAQAACTSQARQLV